MTRERKIHFVASHVGEAQTTLAKLQRQYGQAELEVADVIVALGGDGFMLRTLHRFLPAGLPVYGMKIGDVGFLMNRFREDELLERLNEADVVELNPLCMIAVTEAERSGIPGARITPLAWMRIGIPTTLLGLTMASIIYVAFFERFAA